MVMSISSRGVWRTVPWSDTLSALVRPADCGQAFGLLRTCSAYGQSTGVEACGERPASRLNKQRVCAGVSVNTLAAGIPWLFSSTVRWWNYDVSPRLWFERLPLVGAFVCARGKALFPSGVRYGDIVAGLPHEPSSARAVFCSHVLEHLDRASAVKALTNTHNLLEPGGVFRLVVPDLIWRARQLIAEVDSGQAEAADHFMRQTYLGLEQPATSLVDRARVAFGNSAHRWMYDYGLMERLLGDAGFVAVRRCRFGDAGEPMFKLVEEEDRFWDNGREELAIEARRAGSKNGS
jgi:SAM-dependent methyltransferase